MQLRTVKKPKIKDFDFGNNTANEITSTRKNSHSKEVGEKEIQESSNENSNLTNENEGKSRHKLRNPSGNYQGKYKKMNSGKYLYKLNNSDKKPISKKKQLRFLPLELVQTFKKFLNKLNKKEDENMLSKKKKREEKLEQGAIKQKTNEMQENYNKKMLTKMQNMQQFHQMAEYDYNQPYMMKNPYDFYYQPNYIENLKNQGYPVENPQMFYRMNKDFMKYLNVPEYYYRGQYPPHPFNFEQEPKPKGESIFNLINDKESLNRINKIANQGVNHIVAAFYIKSVQQNRAKSSELNNIARRAPVPINSVPLEDKEENEDNHDKNFGLNTNANITTTEANDQKERNIQNSSVEEAKDIYKNIFNDNNLLKINQNAANQTIKLNSCDNKEFSHYTKEAGSSKILGVSADKDLKTANFSNNNNNNNPNNNFPLLINKNTTNKQEKESKTNIQQISGKDYGNTNNMAIFHGFNNAPQFTQPSRFINSSARSQSQNFMENKPNSSFTKSSFSEDLNQFTSQQLNTVSNMVKRIKENKLSELIEKDNSGNSLKK